MLSPSRKRGAPQAHGPGAPLEFRTLETQTLAHLPQLRNAFLEAPAALTWLAGAQELARLVVP